MSEKTQDMSKKKNSKWKIGQKAVVVLTAVAVVYIGFAVFFQNHFCFGTRIDGIPVGGRGVKSVENLIKEEIDNYTLTLVERENMVETIAGSDIDLKPVFDNEVSGLLAEQKGYGWGVILFRGQELELDKVVSYDADILRKLIGELDVAADKNQREPVNATYSAYSEESGYTLVPADYGTTIDESRLQMAVAEAVASLEEELNLSDSGCYVEPDVTDDDERLLALIDDLNCYVGTTIIYEFGEEKEVLDAQIIHTWLGDEDGKISVDEEAVLAYVKELGKTYNTAYKPKEFETSYGKTVTITNGFYGWRIDNEGELAQIMEDLSAGESVTREPVYLQTANSHGETDYGDSYVEINLTAQHLFLYKDGELVIETDFVSGDVAKGHSTPTGAFGITYTTKDAVLRGEDYATPVTYWMPFAGDVGMHDATWRRSFGSNIYKTNGSHGCINLPLSAAKTIYENVEKGYPVLVYTLPGTESPAVQKQDAANIVSMIDMIGPVTLESETIIVNARNLYNALPDAAKAYVTNIDTLTAAENALAGLKAAQPAEVPAEQPVE